MTGMTVFTEIPQLLAAQILSLLIPGVWTFVIVSAFCRIGLNCTTRHARRLTLVHQALTFTLFFAYVLLVSGVLVRILAVVDR